MNEINLIDVLVAGDEDVRVATATCFVGGELYSATGTARRDPADRPDSDLADLLAIGRATRQLGRKMISDAHEAIRKNDHAVQTQKAARDRLLHKRVSRAKEGLEESVTRLLRSPSVRTEPPAPGGPQFRQQIEERLRTLNMAQHHEATGTPYAELSDDGSSVVVTPAVFGRGPACDDDQHHLLT